MSTLRALLPDAIPDWHELALCQETDPEAFYPDKGGSARAAKGVCSRCEVRAECLQYALDNNEEHGVWGGLNEKERRQLKKQRAAA